MLFLTPARFPADMAQVQDLFLEYANSLGVDISFQDFDQEVEELPGDYAQPDGRLLLARWDGELAGCVGVRRLGADECEMKRLYVRPGFQSLGIGRALAERAIAESRQAGYLRMRLDTLGFMEAAQSLYRSLGFRETPPYYHNPLPGTMFLALELESTEY